MLAYNTTTVVPPGIREYAGIIALMMHRCSQESSTVVQILCALNRPVKQAGGQHKARLVSEDRAMYGEPLVFVPVAHRNGVQELLPDQKLMFWFG